MCVTVKCVVVTNKILHVPSSPGSDVALNVNKLKTKLYFHVL